MKKLAVAFYIAICASLFVSCEKEETETPDTHPKEKIAEQTLSDGTTITLWADQAELTVGYNSIYIRVDDHDDAVQDATIHLHPLMDMHHMQHSSPVEQPHFDPDLQLYAGAIVFTMPSGEMGTWQIQTTVNDETVILDVEIKAEPEHVKTVTTFTGTDGNAYTISLIQPAAPKIGINELEVLVNKRADHNHFPPEEGLTIAFDPQMTSMNHGSPNNVDPVHGANGRYKGRVNFTMSGDWRLHFEVKRDNEVLIEDVSLDLLF